MMNWLKRAIHKWLFHYEYELVIKPGGKSPVRTYERDAGYDLFISKAINIPARTSVNVPTSIMCRSKTIPAWILMTSRSSTLMRHGLIVDQGIIDGDYTGEMFIKVHNITDKDVRIYPNMRIGQIIVLPHTSITFKEVSNLPNTKRGKEGFGSTGD